MAQHQLSLQPIEGLSDPDNFLKVPLRGTFKKLSGFYGSAMRYIKIDTFCVLCLRFISDRSRYNVE
jgi:hypothetical protein